MEEIKNYLKNRDLMGGENIESTLEDLLPWLLEGNIHVPHPGYFGLFNPATSFSAVVGDYLTALLTHKWPLTVMLNFQMKWNIH